MIIEPLIETGRIGIGCCLPPPCIRRSVEAIVPVGPLLNFTDPI
jgi:hypothetical protein